MNILIIDASGCALSFALRCKAAGHEVKAFIRNNKDGSRSEIGDGLITRVTSWERYMKWADLVFCTDNTFYIHGLERFRDQGFPIFGPSVDTNRWEQERDHGEKILNKVGIDTIPSQTFDNYDAAMAFVKANPNRKFVSKPIGDGAKELSYVAKTGKEMYYMLDKWKKTNAYKGKFILQEFRKGIEFAVGGWFGSGGFSKHWCESWEHKKLFPSELGVATGEQGTIVRYTTESKLAEEMLCPLEGMLHGLGYTGYIDVNCIIDTQGRANPLEFTMRPGWPLFNIQQSLHRGDPAQWMLDLIDGRDTLKVSSNIACGVVITLPDYPFEGRSKKDNTGYPIWGLTEEDCVGDFHFGDVKLGKGPEQVGDTIKDVPMFVTCGEYVCTVVGTGRTIQDSKDDAYKTIKDRIYIPNSIQYRDDIGEKVQKNLKELQSYGYAQGVEGGDD